MTRSIRKGDSSLGLVSIPISLVAAEEIKDKVTKGHYGRYVIQKHEASHLHYDFRLELGGVLKSWAIPKGPCLNPKIKRLAIHVADHPIEYGSFEGVIPKGQYGGGTVMLWDKGSWEPLDENPYKAYQKGHLRFNLHAQKLKGRWDLIRSKEDNHWFLIKYQDAHAESEYDITESLSKSVQSNHSLAELKKTTSTKKTFFTITNPDKILYPEDKISKKDLLNYYEAVAEYILPYVKLRPLTLFRCPKDYNRCFYQRHFNKITGKGLLPTEVPESYIYLKDREGLLNLVQMSVLEIHPWGSTIKHLEQPDILILDLDPAPDLPWAEVVRAALDVREHLNQYQLKSFVKTTGGKGLHVVVPILPEYDWEEVKEFTHAFVQFLEKTSPASYISTLSKVKRQGKIFVDYLRNQRTATAISPYSTRAKPHAPVATPLSWDELSANKEENSYTIKTLPQRLNQLEEDPWKDFWNIKQSLRLNR